MRLIAHEITWSDPIRLNDLRVRLGSALRLVSVFAALNTMILGSCHTSCVAMEIILKVKCSSVASLNNVLGLMVRMAFCLKFACFTCVCVCVC